MPTQDVHRSALAKHVEAEFELDRPPEATKDPDDVVNECRMGRVRESVTEPAPISDIDRQARAERLYDPIERTDRKSRKLAVLCARVDGLAEPGAVGHDLLGQTLVEADRPEDTSDTMRVHGLEHGRGGLPDAHLLLIAPTNEPQVVVVRATVFRPDLLVAIRLRDERQDDMASQSHAIRLKVEQRVGGRAHEPVRPPG